MSDSQLRRLAPEIDLAEFTNKNLNLGRPVPSGRIVVPDEVWLDRGVLRWRTRQEPRYREVTQGMLNRFVRLSDARSILSFSQEWGILGMAPGRSERARFISRTMRAKTNDGRERPAYIIVRSLGRKSMLPGRQSFAEGFESLDAWQYYSRRAHALLHIAAALKIGRGGDLRHWDEISVPIRTPLSDEVLQSMLMEAAKIHKYGMGFVVFYVDDHFDPRLLYGRQFVIQELTYWQDCWKRERSGGLSDFALRWRDDKDRWDLQIQYHGLLFAAIALQLMLVVANADSLYCCSGCGTPYIRAFDVKRPKRGCDNYCEDCRGKGIAQRNANARRRARVAAQG